MKEKRISLSVLISCVIITAALTAGLILCLVPNPLRGRLTNSDSLSKYYEIKSLIDDYFVEEISDGELADGMALGAIYSLDDRYSAYFTAEEYSKVLDNNEGLGAGIGVDVTKHPDTGNIYVINVYNGSPAEAAGFKSGDSIVSVDGKNVADLGFDSAVALIGGKEGTVCKIGVLRDGEETVLEPVRGRYVMTSVYYHMIDTVGYIQSTDFNTATVAQFKDAVSDVTDKGATALIFDVRQNSGGTLDSVEKILDIILPEGDVVSATYKNGNKKVLFSSDKNEIDLPMTVLCNEKTASAAELFAAAIRDFGKGKLVGETTYGKGVMQRTFGLSDGSAVRLTIAYFNPPSGINFNGEGLTPDVSVELTDDQDKYYYFLDDQTDPVIASALKVLENG
ncbi:MAG: PDZ domain-containing protein [Clostridia bacterium]|nr:PDZ domain-containing protein [Clostridia bacterium]